MGIDRMLRLTHDARLRTFTRERSVAGVEIVYQPSPTREAAHRPRCGLLARPGETGCSEPA